MNNRSTFLKDSFMIYAQNNSKKNSDDKKKDIKFYYPYKKVIFKEQYKNLKRLNQNN
jgi:hypothetical protein